MEFHMDSKGVPRVQLYNEEEYERYKLTLLAHSSAWHIRKCFGLVAKQCIPQQSSKPQPPRAK